MCQDCGCSITGSVQLHAAAHEHKHDHKPGHEHTHQPGDDHEHHDHEHEHTHLEDYHPHPHTHTLSLKTAVLEKNDQLAAQNRQRFQDNNLLVLNVLSSPGSGKTTFIERTLTDLRDRLPAGVLVGDLATDNDAQRLRRSGAPVVQITTGSACHLEANMIAQGLSYFDLTALKLLVIENVGNLVCPAAYDLGESLRVVLLSVTEGEDKPLKYPVMFKTADLVVITKIDLADAVEFQREVAIANIQRIAPQAKILEVSARIGQGMDGWYHYLMHHELIRQDEGEYAQ